MSSILLRHIGRLFRFVLPGQCDCHNPHSQRLFLSPKTGLFWLVPSIIISILVRHGTVFRETTTITIGGESLATTHSAMPMPARYVQMQPPLSVPTLWQKRAVGLGINGCKGGPQLAKLGSMPSTLFFLELYLLSSELPCGIFRANDDAGQA